MLSPHYGKFSINVPVAAAPSFQAKTDSVLPFEPMQVEQPEQRKLDGVLEHRPHMVLTTLLLQ